MKHACYLVLVAGLVSACAQEPAENNFVNEAAEAMGGASRISAANTLVMEGTGTNRNLGQNLLPDADLPVFNVTEFRRTVDLATGRARQEITRQAVLPAGMPAPLQKQTLGLDGDVAFNVGADGTPTRQPARVAVDRRHELILHHPLGVLRAALDPAAALTNARTEGNTEMVDIKTAQGEQLTLAIDSTTHLPVSVTSLSYNVNLGDVAVKTTFADYQDVDGLKLPTQITSNIDKYPSTDYKITTNRVNAAATDLAATNDVKSAPAPETTANVTVEEVGKGVWLLGGQSHNSVLVEFSDHTELIEAPQHETRSLAVIAKARELKPDKPLTKVVMTHHHFDHSGGVRAAIAEGLTVVTHELNKPFVEEMAGRKHTIVEDALTKNPRAANIETVGEELTVQDAMQTMQIYKLEDSTAHSNSMLIVYFPKDRLLVQADFYNRGEALLPRQQALNNNIQKRKLRVDKHVPIHGTVRSHAEFMKIIQSAT